MRTLLLILAIFWAQDTYACSFRYGSADQRYKKAHSIYMGYVVGVDHEGLEDQIIKDDFNFERKARRIYPKTNYKIRIKETLKGPKKSTMVFTHTTCANGGAEVTKRVIIYRYKTHDIAMILTKELYEEVTTNKFKNEKAASGSDASSTRPF